MAGVLPALHPRLILGDGMRYQIAPGKESKQFRDGVDAFVEDKGYDSCDSVEERMGFLTAFVFYSQLSEHTKSPFMDPFVSRRMQDLLYVGDDDVYQYFDGYEDLKSD